MNSPVTILYVDDDQSNLDLFELTIGSDHRVVTVSSAAEGLAVLGREEVGVIVSDQVMPDTDGVTFLAEAFRRHPNSVRIVVTAYQEVELLLGAINAGHVSDYVLKPWEPRELRELINRASDQYLRRRALEQRVQEREYLAAELRRRYDPAEVVGAGGGLRQVMEVVRAVAPTTSTVLIRGETGTGKELIARTVHALSDRRERMLIKVDCASLAPSLLESELFGHERGAFTNATATHRGRFELADEGTLFLDEVAELPLELQPKLLRVLQDRALERVGGERTIAVDVRVIAATNQDLERRVDEGTFRRDLFYRLHVVPILLPPLRDRVEDLDGLVRHFLAKHGGWRGEQTTVSNAAIELFRSQRWSGNVRELENVIERALLLTKSHQLSASDFVLRPTPTAAAPTLRDEIHDAQRERLRRLMVEADGNIARAARELGVARSTLRSRLVRFGLLR